MRMGNNGMDGWMDGHCMEMISAWMWVILVILDLILRKEPNKQCLRRPDLHLSICLSIRLSVFLFPFHHKILSQMHDRSTIYLLLRYPFLSLTLSFFFPFLAYLCSRDEKIGR